MEGSLTGRVLSSEMDGFRVLELDVDVRRGAGGLFACEFLGVDLPELSPKVRYFIHLSDIIGVGSADSSCFCSPAIDLSALEVALFRACSAAVTIGGGMPG